MKNRSTCCNEYTFLHNTSTKCAFGPIKELFPITVECLSELLKTTFSRKMKEVRTLKDIKKG
jgi:hypothetical protein